MTTQPLYVETDDIASEEDRQQHVSEKLINWTPVAKNDPNAKALLETFDAQRYLTRRNRRIPVAFYLCQKTMLRRIAQTDDKDNNIKAGDFCEAFHKNANPIRKGRLEWRIASIRLHADAESKIDYYLYKPGWRLLGYYVPVPTKAPDGIAFDAPSDPSTNPYHELFLKLSKIHKLMGAGYSEQEIARMQKEKAAAEHKAATLEARVKELEKEQSKNGTDKNKQEKRA